ncbi:MAG TPA: hypothetical protein VHA30_04020 [Patescibacteria group bacterium]|nr:hypothetical protein [Patescibacteria group bacterium]
MDISKFIKFIVKHNITPGAILIVCLVFWFTVFATRGVIFWAVVHGDIPAIFVRGYHIHHFITGFLLALVAGALLSRKIFVKYIPLALLGCGLGLAFDEFIFWTLGSFNYWSLINLVAVITIGTTMASMYVYAKRYDLNLMAENPGHRAAPPYYKAAFIPVIFIALFLMIMFSYRHLAIVQPENIAPPLEVEAFGR